MAAAVLLAACTASSDNALNPGVSTYALKVQQMNICSGYGCIYSDKFAFTESDAVRLEQIMQKGADNASAERVAVAEAIGVMEEITLRRIRFGRDVEKAYQRNLSRRGQMDCVDESLNTTAYLKYLYENGWLRHHKPRKHYAERGLLIDGRYPHKSAVMISACPSQIRKPPVMKVSPIRWLVSPSRLATGLNAPSSYRQTRRVFARWGRST